METQSGSACAFSHMPCRTGDCVEEHVQIARRRRREADWPFRDGISNRENDSMTKAGDERQDANVVFEYSRDPMFRSTHAEGCIGGLPPNGQVHIAFFSERPVLPKRHVFRLIPDGSLGAEVPNDK